MPILVCVRHVNRLKQDFIETCKIWKIAFFAYFVKKAMLPLYK